MVNKTTNSIEIEVVRAEGASNFKYSIKKQGEEYGEAQANEATTYKFSGLTQGGIYTIKVEATKCGEQQVIERTVQVGEIPKAIKGTVEWTGNGQAQVRIYTEEDGYQLEWQKNGINEGSWIREDAGVKEKTITGLANGDKIYARLYDGVSSGEWTNIEVMDNTPPEITRFEATEVKGKSITVEVEARDKESGLAGAETYQYYLGNELKSTSTNNTYIYEGLQPESPYEIKIIVKNEVGETSEKTITLETTEATAEEALTTDTTTYINYEDATGVIRKCVVLYDSSSLYGIEIITMDTVEDVELSGYNGYSTAIKTLNNVTTKYINNIYVDKARNVGSTPNNPSDTTKTNYSTDWNQMVKLGINRLDKTYWLSSIYIEDYSNKYTIQQFYHVRYAENGQLENGNALYIKKGDIGETPIIGTHSYSFSIRPVFHLKSGIKITGGDGTEENPYTLGV